MLITTESELYELETAAGENEPSLVYSGGPIQRIVEGAGLHVIALQEDRLLILRPEGRQEIALDLNEEIHSLLILDEQSLHVLIGTEAPHLYHYRQDAAKVERNESFANLGVRDSFHTPWGGPAAIRSMAATTDGWVYADIHVGSIMRSADRAETWEPVTPELHEDVHNVATSPADDNRVYADTADHVWLSDNRGDSWRHAPFPGDQRYGRAIAVHPREPDTIIATVSDGPHGDNVHGRLYHSTDAGHTWHQAGGDWPVTRKNIDTFHIAYALDGSAWGIVQRTLFRSDDRGATWRAFWEAPAPIKMISCRQL